MTEAKFLLKLLGCEGYAGTLSELKPSSMSAAECSQLCEALARRELVAYESGISRFTLAPGGRTLLTLDATILPVTPDEMKVLKACKGSMTLERLGNRVPESAKQQLIQSLADRRMLKITKAGISEVWLTTRGKQFLAYEYEPTGSLSLGSAELVANYIRFLRKTLSQPDDQLSFIEKEPDRES